MTLLRPLRFYLALSGAGPALAQAEPATIHDSANPAAAQLQDAGAGLRGLPRDSGDAVDWAQALRSGAIAPRTDLDGKGTPQVLALDVVLKNTKDTPWVRFPHRPMPNGWPAPTVTTACSGRRPGPTATAASPSSSTLRASAATAARTTAPSRGGESVHSRKQD